MSDELRNLRYNLVAFFECGDYAGDNKKMISCGFIMDQQFGFLVRDSSDHDQKPHRKKMLDFLSGRKA